MIAIDRFSVCLPFVLEQERNVQNVPWGDPRNFDNNKHDPGGETQDGITQREYDMYRKSRSQTCRDVRNITESEGVVIYRASYWLPHCAEMPPGLDLDFFDSSVNEGCTEAVKMLQYIFGMTVDGVYGPLTASRVRNILIRDLPAIVRSYTARREAVYKEMKGYQWFGTDWERRAAEIGTSAEKMATGNATNV